MSLNVNWDVDKYKLDHECEEHWSLRKAFMEKWKTYYTEERLVCLAQAFSNIEFLGCSYPLELMHEVAYLSRDIVMEYRQSKRRKLQRTFVSASDAAVDRAKGVKREGGVIKEAPSPKNAKIAFVRQGHSFTIDEQQDSVSVEVNNIEQIVPVENGMPGSTSNPHRSFSQVARSLKVNQQPLRVGSPTTSETPALIGKTNTPAQAVEPAQTGTTDNTVDRSGFGGLQPAGNFITGSPNSTNAQTATGITMTERAKDRLDATWTLVKPRQGDRKAPKTTTDTAQPSSSPTGTDGGTGKPKTQTSKWSKKQEKRRLKRQQRRAAASQTTSSEVTPNPTTSAPDQGTTTGTKTTAGKKRAHLDETPRGDSYAEAAKSELVVAVTLASSKHLTREQGDFLMDALQKRVLTEACLGLERGPAFRGKPLYTEGTLRLWCSDNHTLKWLNTVVLETTLPSGEHLIVKKQADIPKKVRCGILIPGIWDKPEKIGRALAYQNRWIKVEKWLLHAAMKQETSTFLVVSIPEDQIPTILSHERRLGYMLGSVYIKFQGQKGKFTETFPGGEGNSSAVEPTPGTSSATPTSEADNDDTSLSLGELDMGEERDILSNDGVPFVKM